MDRMADSGSADMGSIPVGGTAKRVEALLLPVFFIPSFSLCLFCSFGSWHFTPLLRYSTSLSRSVTRSDSTMRTVSIIHMRKCSSVAALLLLLSVFVMQGLILSRWLKSPLPVLLVWSLWEMVSPPVQPWPKSQSSAHDTPYVMVSISFIDTAIADLLVAVVWAGFCSWGRHSPRQTRKSYISGSNVNFGVFDRLR